ncbi:LADA_0E07954g1_1 [Lachancea dasiensis]|uniref:LADA_0E07954g1_1 n=1 Tax=Lachancea dasiensis TaxID=1072105 RepID=A0A1G4JDQ3_9SACH|nr:LADA_0E07954g1_1 [Lachancea dasiensis]
MSVLFDAEESPEKALPRELDLSTSRIAVVGDRGCGKTWVAVRWCYGSLKLLNLADTGGAEDIHSRKIYYQPLVKSQNYLEHSRLQLDLLTNLVEVELLKSNEVAHVSEGAADSDATSQDCDVDVLNVQVLEGLNFEQSDYIELKAVQIKQTDGFLLCYDVTNLQSFQYIKLIYRQIRKLRGDDVPILVCALKSDLLLTEGAVDMPHVAELCDELQVDMDREYLELSALEDFGVNEAFYRLLKDIDAHKEQLRKRQSATRPPAAIAVDRVISGEKPSPDAVKLATRETAHSVASADLDGSSGTPTVAAAGNGRKIKSAIGKAGGPESSKSSKSCCVVC